MWETVTATEIEAPIQHVYDYLADLRRHAEWSLSVVEIRQTSGNGIEVGAEFTAEEMVPAKFTSFSRITRLEAPSRIDWHSWDGRTFQVDWSFELTPKGDATSVVQTARVQPTSLLGRILLLVMRKRQIPGENRKSLARLKEVVETAEETRTAPLQHRRD